MLQKITNSNIIIELKYATNENFVKQKLYDNADCYLHETAAFNLYKASLIAKNLNYKLKIYDAYRPINIQQKLWDKFQDPKYVSDPKNGELTHCRGIAVDLTLTDLNGNEADMGTDFDNFNPNESFDPSKISNHRDFIIHIYNQHIAKTGNKISPNSYEEFFTEIVSILANAKTIERTFERLDSTPPKKELDYKTMLFINELSSGASNQETTKFIDGLKKPNKRVITNPDISLITAEDLAKRLLKEIISYEEKRAELKIIEANIATLASELGEIIPDFVLREDPADNIDLIEKQQAIYTEELSILDSIIDLYERKRDMGLEEASTLDKQIKDRSDEIKKNIRTTEILEKILAALEAKRKITQEEDRLINSTHKLFFERFNSANRLDFLKEISDHPCFRGYLDLKYDGKNILDIAIEKQDIESINFLINIIKRKCPDFFNNSNVGETLIKNLNALERNLDYNGLPKIQFLNKSVRRTMSANKKEAGEVSRGFLQLDESSITHQDSSCGASSPPYMSPTKSPLSIAVGNLTTPQPATKKVNSPPTFNTPLKICKSFLSLLSKKPQIPGYRGSTISSNSRKSPKSKADFDRSTHKTTPKGDTLPLEFDPQDLIKKTEVDSCRFSTRSKSLDRGGDPETSKSFMSQSWSEIKPPKLGFSVKASDEHPRKSDKKDLEIKSNNFRHLIESSSSDDEQSAVRSIFSR